MCRIRKQHGSKMREGDNPTENMQHQFETVQKNDGNFSVKAGHHKALERDCLKRPRFYRGLLKFCGKNKKSCEG